MNFPDEADLADDQDIVPRVIHYIANEDSARLFATAVAAIYAIAYLSGQTPRSIMDKLFSRGTDDDEWRERTLPLLVALCQDQNVSRDTL